MTKYSLQSTTYDRYIVDVYLYSDATLPYFPINDSLLMNGDFIEKFDTVAGEIQVPEMTFTFIESYTGYVNEGFWFRVLRQDFEIEIQLKETGGTTVLFWGKKKEGTLRFNEFDLGSQIQRGGEFTCIALPVAKLKELTLDTLNTYIQTIDEADTGGSLDTWEFLKITDLFSAMLYQSGLNPSFTSSDTSMSGDDFRMYNVSNAGPYSISALYVATDLPSPQLGFLETYKDNGSYSNCFDFMMDLCKTIGAIPRMYYDLDDNLWKIELYTRGHSYTGTNVIFPTPKFSDLMYPIDTVIETVVVDSPQLTSPIWINAGQESAGNPSFSADISTDLLLDAIGSGYLTPNGVMFYHKVGAGDFEVMTQVEFYDYTATDWDSTKRNHHAAVGHYQYNRYNHPYQGYERTYAGISASLGTRLTTYATPGRVSLINDGVDNLEYYISEVRKNIASDEMNVRWVQVHG